MRGLGTCVLSAPQRFSRKLGAVEASPLAPLDALRGLSALVVLAAHGWQVFVAPSAVGSLLARLAVLAFFALSGYVITHSLAQNVARHGRLDALAYLHARVRRIYPPLLGAVALVWLAHWLAPEGRLAALTWGETLDALRLRAGLLSVNGPLWSLYIEAHIYVIALAGAGALVGRWRVLWGLAAVWLVADAWMHFPAFWWCGLTWAAGAAVYALRLPIRWPAPQWAVRSAGFSYSLYVTHFPVLLLASAWAVPGVVAVAFALLFAVGFARVFERQRADVKT